MDHPQPPAPDEPAPAPRRRWAPIAGVIGAIVAALVIKFAGGGLIDGLFGPRSATPESVERQLNAVPQAREILAVLKERYPADHARLLSIAAQASNAGDAANASREGYEFARGMMRAHMEGFAQAPTASLQEIAGQYLRIARALRAADPAYCASFMINGFTPGQRPPAEAASMMQHAVALQLRAASDGERSPARRTALTDADEQAFGEAIERAMPGSAALLAEPTGLAGATPQQQCDVGVAVHQAAASLPAEQSAKVTVDLLRESITG